MTPKPQPSPNPAEKQESRRRRRVGKSRKAVWAILATVFIGVGAVLGQKFLYPKVREYRGLQFAREATRLLEAGKTNEALPIVKNANRFAPDHEEIIRLRARFLFRQNPQEALRDWENLAARKALSFEDKVDFLETSVGLHRADISAQILLEIGSAQSTNSRILKLGINHLIESGFTDRAIGLARYALARDPLSLENQFTLGSLLVANTNDFLHEEGRGLLTDVARVGSDYQTPALQRLIAGGRLQDAHIPELIGLLDLHPENITNFVNALTLRWQVRTNDRAEFSRAAASRLEQERSTNNAIVLAEWLLVRSPKDLLPVLTDARIEELPLLAVSRAEAYARIQDWENLSRSLNSPHLESAPFSKFLLKARLAVAEGRRTEAENLIQGSADLVAKFPQNLAYVARIAEEIGLPDSAVRVWVRVAEFPPLSLYATSEVLRLSRNLDQLKSEAAVLARISSAAPGDLRLAGERAEREVMVGTNIPQAEQALREALADKSTTPVPEQTRRFQSALALARLRQGDAPGALELFEQSEFDWKTLPTRSRVIYVAILGANQQRETARKFAQQLDPGSLKSQERELVEPWL